MPTDVFEALTHDQFISLLMIGDMGPTDLSPYLPIDEERLLIRLGYVQNLNGRLSMTPPGRVRIASRAAGARDNHPVQD
jgi:hypothetical protein